jgi:CspA family cold shock protein
MTGTIKNANAEKGYGFILGKDGRDYFFHSSALKNCSMSDLERGREVTFEDAEGSKGPRAEDVYV